MTEPESTRRHLLFALVEGLLCGLIVVCVLKQAVGHLAAASPLRPGWIPTFLWMWLSASLPIGLGRLAYRLQSEAPGSQRAWIGRSAAFLLLTLTLALVVGCGWGLCRPGLAAMIAFVPALVCADLMVRLAEERRRRLALAVACLLTIVSLPVTVWPLRLTTAVSRSALETVADQVEAGDPVRRPRLVGVFVIQGSQLRGGVPFLLTAPDPAGYGGLARCPRAELRAWFNLWSSFSIGDSWNLVFED